MAGILVSSRDQFSVMDPQSLLVSQGKKLKNVVLFEREDVRVMENGEVFTKSLSEIDGIKRKPGRFKTRLNFPRDMTSDAVRSVLEMNFPLLQNRRYVRISQSRTIFVYISVLSCLFYFPHGKNVLQSSFIFYKLKGIKKKVAAVSLSYCSKSNLKALNVARHKG